MGPMLSFKGIDNAAYYRLIEDDRRYYMDYTGTGNSLNMRHPYVLQLLMDSLRYWVTDMHVDGFRFDLASTLARGLHEVDRLSAFFDLIQQDPVISQVKLIAEPWDVGEGGYQVGNFPPQWAEWNGKYRDCLRDYWRGADQTLGEFAYRFTGSSDLYEDDGRRPTPASTSSRRTTGSRCATSSPTTRSTTRPTARTTATARTTTAPGTAAWKDRPTTRGERAPLASAAQPAHEPVPLAGHSDAAVRRRDRTHAARATTTPTARTTRSPGSTGTNVDEPLLEFTRALIGFRLRHRVFRRRTFFQGRPIHGTDVSDIAWFTPDRRRDGRGPLGRGLRQGRDGLPQRRRPRARSARRGVHRRLVPRAVQRPPRAGGVHAAGGEVGRRVDRGHRHP